MASNAPQKRGNPFSRTGSSSPAPSIPNGRPRSIVSSSPLSSTQSPGHNRSYSSLAGVVSTNYSSGTRECSNSKNGTTASSTFAPSFIKSEEIQRGPEAVKGIEGENDFSGKRYVWLKDPQTAFVKGWVVDELESNHILVQCDDGSVGQALAQEINGMLTVSSKEKCTQIVWTRLILRSSIKPTTWQNSHTSTRLLLFIICTCDTRRI